MFRYFWPILFFLDACGTAGSRAPAGSPADNLAVWDSSGFSDPRHHNPKNFVYIVRTTSAWEDFERDEPYGIIHPTMFASLIDNERPVVFGNWGAGSGVILDIKPGHVIATRRTDSATMAPIPQTAHPTAQEYRSVLVSWKNGLKEPFYMPRDLLRESKVRPFPESDLNENELVLAGVDESNHPVTVQAFFSLVDANGWVIEHDSFVAAQAAARRMRLPFVQIRGIFARAWKIQRDSRSGKISAISINFENELSMVIRLSPQNTNGMGCQLVENMNNQPSQQCLCFGSSSKYFLEGPSLNFVFEHPPENSASFTNAEVTASRSRFKGLRDLSGKDAENFSCKDDSVDFVLDSLGGNSVRGR